MPADGRSRAACNPSRPGRRGAGRGRHGAGCSGLSAGPRTQGGNSDAVSKSIGMKLPEKLRKMREKLRKKTGESREKQVEQWLDPLLAFAALLTIPALLLTKGSHG